MVGLLLQETAVGKNPPTGVGAMFTGSKVDVGVVEAAAGTWVAVGLFPPPPDWVAVGGRGVGVRVGTVCLAPAPHTVGTRNVPIIRNKITAATDRRNLGLILFMNCFC